MERKGFYATKKGTTIKRFGRRGAEAHKIKAAKKYLADGMGILKAAKLSGLGTSTVHRLKRDMRWWETGRHKRGCITEKGRKAFH
jgi:hypothetical protein